MNLFLTVSTATLREHGLSIAGALAAFDNGRPRRLRPEELESVKRVTGSTNLRFFRLVPTERSGTLKNDCGVNLVGYISSAGFRSRQVRAVFYFPYKYSLWKIRDVLPHLLPPGPQSSNRPRVLIQIGREVPKEKTGRGRRRKTNAPRRKTTGPGQKAASGKTKS